MEEVDLFFMQSSAKPFQVTLIGLETYPDQRQIPPQTQAFVVSFKPIAVEYILNTTIADVLNSAKELPNNSGILKLMIYRILNFAVTKLQNG
jgi:hypothetical protein